jgi:hypothetical protein
VFPIVYHDGPLPASTVTPGQSSSRIAYPAFGDPR